MRKSSQYKQKEIHMHWHSNIRIKAESCSDEIGQFSVHMLCAALLSWGSCSYVGAWVCLQLVQLLWKLSQNTGAQVGAALGHGSAHAVGEEIIHTAHSNRTGCMQNTFQFYSTMKSQMHIMPPSYMEILHAHTYCYDQGFTNFWLIWYYNSNGQIMQTVISCISWDHAVHLIACFTGNVA